MRAIFVATCGMCPFYFEGAHCTHKDMPSDARDLWSDQYGKKSQYAPPARCPLRKEPTTIAISPEAVEK